MLENNLALELARIARVGLLRNDRIGVEDRLDALQADRGLRDDVGHFREVLHRLEELVEIGKKHRQRADGHRVAQNQPRPAPEHERHAARDGHRDDGREQRLHAPGFERRLHGLLARVLSRSSSVSCRPNALTERTDSKPCSTRRRCRSGACAPRGWPSSPPS